ncbi:MAG: hypothetical protein IME98_02280, partial [Proteobacteria bacterium]|nr:hypothetical protein [Pseudomonadota bacterium]
MKKNLFLFLSVLLLLIFITAHSSQASYNVDGEMPDISEDPVDLSGIEMNFQNGRDNAIDGLKLGGLYFPNQGAFLVGASGNSNSGMFLEFKLLAPLGAESFSLKLPASYMISDITVSGSRETLTPFPRDVESATSARDLIEHETFLSRRAIKNKTNISAQKYLGVVGDPFGITLSYEHPLYHVDYTVWAPEYNERTFETELNYLKGVLTPTINGIDLELAIQWWGGKMSGKSAKFPNTTFAAEALGFDVRANSAIGSHPVAVRMTYATAKGSDSTFKNILNLEGTSAREAYSIEGEIGIIEDRLNLALGFRGGKTGDETNNVDNAVILGAVYALPNAVQLRVNHIIYSG